MVSPEIKICSLMPKTGKETNSTASTSRKDGDPTLAGITTFVVPTGMVAKGWLSSHAFVGQKIFVGVQ